MFIRTSLKQLFRSPIKLVAYFLIAALAAALLCVGLNLNGNAQRNVAAAEAAFETVAVPNFSAHIRYDGTLCADPDDPFYAGYLPCFTSEYDFAPILAAPGVESLDARGHFGARVNGEGNLIDHAPGDGPRNGVPDDVIIFTVGAAERVTVSSQSAPIALSVTIDFSVMGKEYYGDTLEINNYIFGGQLQGIATPDGGVLPGPLFDVGTEAADGSFNLEPGMQYIAAVRAGMSLDAMTGVIRATSVSIEVGDAYHDGGELRYNKASGWSLVPGGNAYILPYVAIAPYEEGFFETERGAYFQQIIDAFRANFNSLNAIATNDLAAMRPFHSGGVHIAAGRVFTAEEYAVGAKVCLVSELMAELNGWKIGDTLSLSFYETEYPFTKKTERFSVFRSPTDGFFDEGGYEIIGLFAGNVITGDTSPRYTQGEGLDALDILLPQKSVSNAPAPVISEYTTSIRLKNSAAEDFMAEIAASGLMEELEGGYQLGLTVYDQGYSHVGPGLRQLSRVSRLTLTLALAVAGLAVVVLAVVHALRGRRGVAAMRSLGTKRGQIAVISLAGVALVCLLGACAGAYAGHALSANVASRVVESAKEDAADTSFTAMMGEDGAKEFEFLLDSNPELALVSGGAVAGAFLLCAGLLLMLEFRRSPMLLLGAKE